MITSKAVAGAPEYTVVIKEWKTDGQPGADHFAFAPPAGAQKLDIKALRAWDEVPPEMAAKGDQQ